MKNQNEPIFFTPPCNQPDRRRRLYGGGGGSDSTNSITTQDIPEELKPLATRYTKDAIALSDTPYQAYGGQRNADLNAAQYKGLGLTMDRALEGSATNDNAEAAINQFIGGQDNPYLDAAYQNASEQVGDSVNGNFSQAGRYGSGAHTASLTKGLGDVATNIYGGAYEADQGRRLQAAGMAPEFGNLAYQDASQLLGAGQTLQDQDQNNADFAYQQYQDEQNDPYKKLAGMSGVFGTNLGGSSSTQSSGGGGK